LPLYGTRKIEEKTETTINLTDVVLLAAKGGKKGVRRCEVTGERVEPNSGGWRQNRRALSPGHNQEENLCAALQSHQAPSQGGGSTIRK